MNENFYDGDEIPSWADPAQTRQIDLAIMNVLAEGFTTFCCVVMPTQKDLPKWLLMNQFYIQVKQQKYQGKVQVIFTVFQEINGFADEIMAFMKASFQMIKHRLEEGDFLEFHLRENIKKRDFFGKLPIDVSFLD